MNRGVAALLDWASLGFSSIGVVSRGNLIALMLKYFDERTVSSDWQHMSNPDVFEVEYETGILASVRRVWSEI